MTSPEWNQESIPEIDTQLLNSILAERTQNVSEAAPRIVRHAGPTDPVERTLFDVTATREQFDALLFGNGLTEAQATRTWRVGQRVVRFAAAHGQGPYDVRPAQDEWDIDLRLLETGLRYVESGAYHRQTPRGLGEKTWNNLVAIVESLTLPGDPVHVERWDKTIHPHLGQRYASRYIIDRCTTLLREKYKARKNDAK